MNTHGLWNTMRVFQAGELPTVHCNTFELNGFSLALCMFSLTKMYMDTFAPLYLEQTVKYFLSNLCLKLSYFLASVIKC